ncbi:MAG: hypothetical protein PHX25_02110 [Candidatus Pacebacteria bacterium]|nr:hypothetical protein [Candidatus Paceibacterota bacterium]
MFKINLNNRGITLLEALFAIGIVFLLFVFGIKPFEAVRDRQMLNRVVEDVEKILQSARTNSQASTDASSYGVHFEVDRATFFAGSFYFESDPDNQTIIFDDNVNITELFLVGGGSDVVFNRITGDTNTSGSIKFSLIDNPSRFKLITVFPIGTIFSNY